MWDNICHILYQVMLNGEKVHNLEFPCNLFDHFFLVGGGGLGLGWGAVGDELNIYDLDHLT